MKNYKGNSRKNGDSEGGKYIYLLQISKNVAFEIRDTWFLKFKARIIK